MAQSSVTIKIFLITGMTRVELKTQKSKQSVAVFLNAIPEPKKRKDAKAMLALMKEVTKERPVLWGNSIVGFGEYTYKYASGREGVWMRTAFSPRKQNLTVYIMPGYTFPGQKDLLKKLGPHKTGKSCLYIKSLDDVHLPTLKKIIKEGWLYMKKKYPK